MAQFKTDLQDIYFNLFNVNKVQDHSTDLGIDDLKDIISQFNKFTENEIYPTRMKGDEEGVKIVDGKVIVPECFHSPNKQFYENGWYALGYPEDIGGMPAPHAVSITCNSIAIGANVAFSMYYGLTRGAMNVIHQVGTQAQKDLYVPKMMSGEWGGTMCLTEAGAGSDVGAAQSTATPIEGGKYSIKGVKIFISSGESDLYENNIHLVLAKTPNAPKGSKGLSLFIVPRFNIENGSSNNVTCTKIEEKMGIHASATCELTFGQDGECVGELIGEEFAGMANMFIMMNEARLLCGLQGESQANLAYMLTEQYARERVQFGTEICNLPDVRRLLLKMRALSRGMRALTLYTGNLFDLEHTDEIAAKEIALLTPICKAYCSDEGFNVAVDAVQVHGGYGFCTEYGVEQFIRDTKIASIYEGTNGIQAIDFVTRKILKDKAQTFFAVGKKIQAVMETPEAKEFTHETSMIGKSMEMSEEILKRFSKMVAEKKELDILSHSTDFLNYCGNLVVAWMLLEHAVLAKKEMATECSEEEKKYYQSKIVDFKIFCQYQLVKNIGIGNSILNFENNLMKLEL
ncbi:acyl-CoA dehydrogenase [Halobacteriovorax sp. HLS]|uniref:acyl-CoA dehydrogenase n=1 Tax=Halobacteriovorax sp. HLS TaxID=2234000 RepID=UPI000FDC6D76|nr:acyl-CoA dehydrogenase [Halobacteriovorax sp. HLS]